MVVLEAPIESPSTMSHVERYHAPLRGAYLKLRDEFGKDVHRNEVRQPAVKAVNDTVGPEGLCPTLLFLDRFLDRPERFRLQRSLNECEPQRKLEKK